MDYKEEYNKALEVAKKYQGKHIILTEGVIEEMFPKLKEADDDVTRREIIGFIRTHRTRILESMFKKWITWLENQSHKCPTEWSEKDKTMLDNIINIIDSKYYLISGYKEMIYWLKSIKPQSKQEPTPIVSIAEMNGEKGIRLCVGDIDLFIEAHDLDEDGKEFKWDAAMTRLKKLGKRTFDKHEMHLIVAYKDQINAALREIGGRELDYFCWSSTEYSSIIAWFVNFNSGIIYNTYKYYTYVVRPCAAFI